MDNIIDTIPRPAPFVGDTYEEYLESSGLLDGTGFSYRELVNAGQHNKQEPDEHYWHRIVPTLALAIELRARIVRRGAAGLLIAAAHRPNGGAPNSQHKRNAALDLDLLPDNYTTHRRAYYEEAARIWSEYGEEFKVGLGFYGGQASDRGGIRVHIDTAFRTRCWWGYPSKGPLPADYCEQLGLPVPSRRHS